jgi:hypothetical protein
VGIGTSIPFEKLHVVGNALVSGNIETTGDVLLSNNAAQLRFTHTNSGFLINVENTTNSGIYYDASNNYWEWRGAGVQRGYVDLDTGNMHIGGDLSIGTATPAADLTVVGGATLGRVLIAPNEVGSGDDSELFFAEDLDGTYGMFFRYDGAANYLELFGEWSPTVYGPHLRIERDTGYTEFGGDVHIAGDLTFGNQAAFRASKGTSNVVGNGWVKVDFDAEVFDQGSDFDLVNDRFTAPTAGIYNFSARVTLNDLDPDTRYVVALYKNGSSECYLDSGYSAGNDYSQYGGSADLNLSAGDYVEVWSYSSDATTTRHGLGNLYTHFSGHRVR